MCGGFFVFFSQLKLTLVCFLYFNASCAYSLRTCENVFCTLDNILYIFYGQTLISFLQAFCHDLYFCVTRSCVCVTAAIDL